MSKTKDTTAISKPKSYFELIDKATKGELLQNRKALNTKRAIKQWVLCFIELPKLPDVDNIDIEQLSDIIGDLRFSRHKNKISDDGIDQSNNKLSHYKNSPLKSGCAALDCYFKGNYGLDIISNAKFIKVNEIFQAVTKQSKE